MQSSRKTVTEEPLAGEDLSQSIVTSDFLGPSLKEIGETQIARTQLRFKKVKQA